jgi:thymidylate synthase (FAD)
MAPEQARMFLPLNTMTEWVWSGSLAAFSRVCKLRLDAHAQLEIQELAQGIKAVVEPLFPVSFTALMET